MPLFGSRRDAGFLRGIQRELMHRIISNEVAIYKIDIPITETNIYGEAEDRKYKDPVKAFAKILPEDIETTSDKDVLDMTRRITFAFLKSDLKDKNIIVEEGDIIYYDSLYYEVDDSNAEKYWTNRDPNSLLGITQDNWPVYGYDHTIIAICHLVKSEILNIDRVREGVNIDNDIDNSYQKII